MNFWGFPASIMQDLEQNMLEFLAERGDEMKSECYIPTVVDEMLNSGMADCHILETTSSWFGVTYPEDKAICVDSIRALIEAGEYPSALWQNKTLAAV